MKNIFVVLVIVLTISGAAFGNDDTKKDVREPDWTHVQFSASDFDLLPSNYIKIRALGSNGAGGTYYFEDELYYNEYHDHVCLKKAYHTIEVTIWVYRGGELYGYGVKTNNQQSWVPLINVNLRKEDNPNHQ